MKKVYIILLFALFLVACKQNTPTETHSNTIIDWVDFVKIDNKQYERLHSVAISDSNYIGDEMGNVEFKVNENISDPYYTVKNGDAAFLEKGTAIYEIEGMSNHLAVADESQINGYRIYQLEDVKKNWRYENVNQENLDKIEIQEGYKHPKVNKTLSEGEEINELLHLLDRGQEKTDYIPHMDNEDPDMYYLVFYTGRPVAPYYQLNDDGKNWYWYPRELETLPSKIEKVIRE